MKHSNCCKGKEIVIKLPTCCCQNDDNGTAEHSCLNILAMDFTKPQVEREAALIEEVKKLYHESRLFENPVLLKYVWKTNYDVEDAPLLYHFVNGEYSLHENNIYMCKFVSSKEVRRMESPYESIAYEFQVGIYIVPDTNEINVGVSSSVHRPKAEPMVLVENCDGQITVVDETSSQRINENTWGQFYKALTIGRFPSLMLKTTNSGIAVPTAYYFERLEGEFSSPKFIGYIEIQYLKDTEEGKQLWFEKRLFEENNPFIGFGSMYRFNTESDLIVAKIPVQ